MSLSSLNSKNNLFTALRSSIISKLIIAIGGLVLLLFTIVHLGGNLLIFSDDRSTINEYSRAIDRFGWAVTLIELLLLFAFLAHVAIATVTARRNLQARTEGYRHITSAGNPSRQSIFSTTMKYTGGILLLFMIFHVASFKFGIGTNIPTIIDGEGTKIKDVYRLIISTFRQPIYLLIYVGAAISLSFHLQHGCLSALQSLGFSNPKYLKVFEVLSMLLSLLIAVGFAAIPIGVYFGIVL
jgi:succinate dehydrogenase / fumarate reductase, cytochrome b subunit